MRFYSAILVFFFALTIHSIAAAQDDLSRSCSVLNQACIRATTEIEHTQMRAARLQAKLEKLQLATQSRPRRAGRQLLQLRAAVRRLNSVIVKTGESRDRVCSQADDCSFPPTPLATPIAFPTDETPLAELSTGGGWCEPHECNSLKVTVLNNGVYINKSGLRRTLSSDQLQGLRDAILATDFKAIAATSVGQAAHCAAFTDGVDRFFVFHIPGRAQLSVDTCRHTFSSEVAPFATLGALLR